MNAKSKPEDFGPGKNVSPAQSVQFLEENWQKLLMMAIMRINPKNHTLKLTTHEIERFIATNETAGPLSLALQMDDTGVHLAVLDTHQAEALKRFGGVSK